MKILVVTHYYSEHGGGVERVALELIRRLIGERIEVTWAASAPQSRLCWPQLSLLPMRCWNFVERHLGIPYPLWSPKSLAALLTAVARCDVLHLHDSLYMGNFAAFACARALGKPVLVTQHIGDIPYRHPLARYLLRAANATLAAWVLGGSSRAVFCSDKVRRYFSSKARFRAEPICLANGVDIDLFVPAATNERLSLRRRFGWSCNRPLFLFVGRFVEKKGLHIIRELAERFPGCTWVLAGDGPLKPDRWYLPNVHDIGWVDHNELPELYQAADLVVLPSVGEGFPLVVQEAMACGTPVLISDDTASGSAGIEHMAFVCPPQTDKTADIIGGLLSDPVVLQGRRQAVAAYARSHWNWDNCAERYLELFIEMTHKTIAVDGHAAPCAALRVRVAQGER